MSVNPTYVNGEVGASPTHMAYPAVVEGVGPLSEFAAGVGVYPTSVQSENFRFNAPDGHNYCSGEFFTYLGAFMMQAFAALYCADAGLETFSYLVQPGDGLVSVTYSQGQGGQLA